MCCRAAESSPDPEGFDPSGMKTRASDKYYSSSYPNYKGDNAGSGKDGSLVNTLTKKGEIPQKTFPF